MKNFPIEALSCSTRVTNKLKENKIFTFNDLSKWREDELLKIKMIGQFTVNSIQKRLSEFIGLNHSTKLTFNDVLTELKKNMEKTTEEEFDIKNKLNFYNLFSNLFRYISLLNLTTKEQIILNKRLRFIKTDSDFKKYTLQQIGNLEECQISRERVRQIEEKLKLKINDLIKSFIENNNKAFTNFVSKLNQELKNIIIIEWPKELLVIFPINVQDIKFTKQFVEFFIEKNIINNQLIDSIKINNTSYLIGCNSIDLKIIRKKILNSLNILNKSDLPIIYERNIFMGLDHHSIFEKTIIRKILTKESKYKYTSQGKYKKKMFTNENLAYEILDRKNKPMHYKAVYDEAKKITKRRLSIQTIHNALQDSKYIHPTVGVGMYALTRWGNEIYFVDRFNNELSIESLVNKYLIKNGPSSINEIENYVNKHRKASSHSISGALYKLGCTYSSEWGGYHWYNQKIELEIKNLLKNDKKIKLLDIINILKELGYSKRNIMSVINNMAINIDKENYISLNI